MAGEYLMKELKLIKEIFRISWENADVTAWNVDEKLKWGFFLFFFYLMYVHEFWSRPQEYSEVNIFESALQILKYQFENNISLEKIFQAIHSQYDLVKGNLFIHFDLVPYSGPTHHILRFLTLKLPGEPIVVFNLSNLFLLMLYFYFSFLLLKIIAGKKSAFLGLIIMLSIYSPLTVGRYSQRGYLIIGTAFAFLGCYFLLKTFFNYDRRWDRRWLAWSGVAISISWYSAAHSIKLTPAFLALTAVLYLYLCFENRCDGRFTVRSLFIDSLSFALPFLISSLFITVLTVYLFELPLSHFFLILKNDYFLHLRGQIGVGATVEMNELIVRLREAIYFPARGWPEHLDEHILGRSLIPTFYILFFIFYVIHLVKTFRSPRWSLKVYAFSIFLMFWSTIPLLPKWEMRYTLFFIPFISIAIVFGIKQFVQFLKKSTSIVFRKSISAVVICAFLWIYVSLTYEVNYGAYAKNSNNVYLKGSGAMAKSLGPYQKKYPKTVTFFPPWVQPEQIICHLGFDLNHKYRVWHTSTSPDDILNPVLEVERAGGRAFIIMPGKQTEHYWGIIKSRLLNTRLIAEVENREPELAIPKPFPNAFYSHEKLSLYEIKTGVF